ncbi:glucose 1-dehydrogenase [Tepidiforma flava]|uniref:Glucose 1-dehydrogenase n=1 Tax=Tepidiforma flava TaxID=3004094 RepID=A0ABY7M9S8_9CHLR|nr:glucose 1-dehydrogenase [Tepidiforma flava]WBL37306.1 glucose 1-dehydrogenase [Tepidiforma flava]
MGRLEGQVAIVTGGASGIGEQTVRTFVAEGARVVIADVQEERGHHLAEALGTQTSFLRTNVAEEADVAGAVDHALAKWGRLDVMFNNAGFGGVGGPIDELDMAAYDQTMAVLLRGVVIGAKHAARAMKPARRGVILNTSSVAGLQAGFGPVVYSAAKAAVAHLSRCLAVELAEFGIRVNAICPGVTVTNIFAAGMGLSGPAADALLPRIDAALANWAPLGRSGQPADIANAALWLASDEASYVTGQAIVVDGGLTAGRSLEEFGQRLAAAMGLTPEQWQAMREAARGAGR